MRRTYGFLCLIATVCTFSGVIWWTKRGGAETPGAVTPSEPPRSPALPVTQVVLFNSGVGYLQREGIVEGTARVDLTFAMKDMNDLLKSVVLEDHDGGRVSAVSYESQEPVENTLRSFALDLTSNPTFAELLNQARGEKVEIKTPGGATLPAAMTGSIVGLETQLDGQKQIVFLNLLTVDGVRNIPLTSVQTFRFLNPAVEADFRHALEVLARTHDSQKKQVSFNFVGEGKRGVKVGYVVESPMWNYRLAIDKEGKLKLKGWAVVENTSDEDWKDVRLALVVARPISFTMDQYQPLFVPRPPVEPELFALLRPPVISPALTTGDQFRAGQFGQIGGQFGQFGGIGQIGQIGGIGQMGPVGQQGSFSGKGQFLIDPTTGLPLPPAPNPGLSFEELQQRRQQALNERTKAREMGSAIASFQFKEVIDGFPLPEGGETQESYQYVVDQKVSISRQKSALLPIIDEEVKGQRVSIYNEKNIGKVPLLGVRVTNTTKKPLMQGPVMVYDGNSYAGDARLLDVPLDGERMLAYAVDLGLEVKVVKPEAVAAFVKETPGAFSDVMAEGSVVARWPTAVKVVNGLLNVTKNERATKALVLRNRSREDRTVIIEHPVDAQWKLLSPKPFEVSRDFYRFEVAVPAGKSVGCDLVRERATNEAMDVTTLDQSTLKFYLEGKLASPAVKAAMQKVLDRRAVQKAFEEDYDVVATELKTALDNQSLVRWNLDRVPKASESYRQYLGQFDAQETQIQKLQLQVKEKEKVVRQKQRAYADDLTRINAE